MSDQPEALRLADRLDFWGDKDAVREASSELRRQHDEIEKLRGEVARLTELHTLYQDKTERLKAERDAAVADAERYRWLRDWERGTHDILPMTGRYGDRAILGDELDAAIDAAKGDT